MGGRGWARVVRCSGQWPRRRGDCELPVGGVAMRKILWVLLPWLAIVSTAAHGHEVEVLETYPPGDRVELGPGQEFHLRVAYTADPIARIFARPYLDGREVRANNSPSPGYRGSGETTVWFSFADVDDRADEIHVFIGNNSGLKKPALVHRVSVAGSTTAGAAPPAQAWVATLQERGVGAPAGGSPQKNFLRPVTAGGGRPRSVSRSRTWTTGRTIATSSWATTAA